MYDRTRRCQFLKEIRGEECLSFVQAIPLRNGNTLGWLAAKASYRKESVPANAIGAVSYSTCHFPFISLDLSRQIG
jgi:hypothetical protein